MKALGKYIRDIRCRSGCSVFEFAQINQISLADLLKIEKGETLPSKWNLLKMAGKLSLDPRPLLVKHQTELITFGNNQSPNSSERTEVIIKDLQQWSKKGMTLQSLPVHELLKEYIESIIYYENSDQHYASEVLVPDGMPRLIIDLNESQALLVGQRDKPLLISLKRSLRQVIIRFLPSGLHPLTGIPQDHLRNQILDAAYIFGKPVHTLCQELADGDQSEIIKGFFTRLLPGNDNNLVEKEVIRFVVQHIDKRIAEVTHKSGYSSKHLIHLFHKHVGITPKVLQQIQLFSASMDDISLLPTQQLSGYNWSNRYFDQSHFTRQFTRFSGFTPTDFLKTGNTCPRMILLDG